MHNKFAASSHWNPLSILWKSWGSHKSSHTHTHTHAHVHTAVCLPVRFIRGQPSGVLPSSTSCPAETTSAGELCFHDPSSKMFQPFAELIAISFLALFLSACVSVFLSRHLPVAWLAGSISHLLTWLYYVTDGKTPLWQWSKSVPLHCPTTQTHFWYSEQTQQLHVKCSRSTGTCQTLTQMNMK